VVPKPAVVLGASSAVQVVSASRRLPFCRRCGTTFEFVRRRCLRVRVRGEFTPASWALAISAFIGARSNGDSCHLPHGRHDSSRSKMSRARLTVLVPRRKNRDRHDRVTLASASARRGLSFAGSPLEGRQHQLNHALDSHGGLARCRPDRRLRWQRPTRRRQPAPAVGGFAVLQADAQNMAAEELPCQGVGPIEPAMPAEPLHRLKKNSRPGWREATDGQHADAAGEHGGFHRDEDVAEQVAVSSTSNCFGPAPSCIAALSNIRWLSSTDGNSRRDLLDRSRQSWLDIRARWPVNTARACRRARSPTGNQPWRFPRSIRNRCRPSCEGPSPGHSPRFRPLGCAAKREFLGGHRELTHHQQNSTPSITSAEAAGAGQTGRSSPAAIGAQLQASARQAEKAAFGAAPGQASLSEAADRPSTRRSLWRQALQVCWPAMAPRRVDRGRHERAVVFQGKPACALAHPAAPGPPP